MSRFHSSRFFALHPVVKTLIFSLDYIIHPAVAYASPISLSLAGPALMNKVSVAETQVASAPTIRKEFPETWIWEMIDEERLPFNICLLVKSSRLCLVVVLDYSLS